MKKIFYILASAIVALGAVACDNQDLENIAPATEGLTIVANIDDATKVAFDGLTPSWEAGKDVLVIGDYTFEYTQNNTFVCEAEGVYSLCDGTEKEITAGEFNSANGLAGSAWAAKSVIAKENTTVTLKLTTAVLKYTTVAAGVKFYGTALSEEGFAANNDGNVQYIPVKAGNGTFSYKVNDAECKSLTKDFVAGKVYDLGYVGPKSDWYVWDEGAQKRIDMFDEYGLAVAHITTKNNIKFSNGTDWIGKQYSDATPKDTWYIGSDYNSQVNISNSGVLHVYFDTYAKKWYLSDKNEVPAFLSVIGTIGGSNWNKDFTMTWEKGWYVATVTATAGNEFKVRHCFNWVGDHGYSASYIEAGKDLVSDSNGNFKITNAGTYKISLKQDHSKIKIEKL